MIKILISLCTVMISFIYSKPVVIIDLPGLLGNRLFAYCAAKIIANEMGEWKVCSKPIWGFPETYSCQYNVPSKKYRKQVIEECPTYFFNYQKVFRDKTKRNIELKGYFISYDNLKGYKNLIRNEWLKIKPELRLPKKDSQSIVVHVRAQYPDCYFIPFEFYQKALSEAKYDRVRSE